MSLTMGSLRLFNSSNGICISSVCFPYRRSRLPSALPIPRRRHSSSIKAAVSFSTTSAMGDVPDANMDAVQRRLMFEDEYAFPFLFIGGFTGMQATIGNEVTFPLVWANTCFSHPLYRESELIEENGLGVRNAAQRKLLDELGILAEDLPVDQFIPLGRMLYKASDGQWGEHELLDVKANPNPEEVADIKYANRDQLKELLRKVDAGEEGLKLSPWFRLIVDNVLFKWWDHLEKRSLKEVIDMKTIYKLT